MFFNWFKKKKIISPIHGPITFTSIQGHRALRAGGVTHSGGEIWPMWEEVMKKVSTYEILVTNALVLGVGGGDVIKIIRNKWPKSHIKGVEIDETMVNIAKDYFNLTIDPYIRIDIEDAIEWMKKERETKFDLIICDLYIGPLNPLESRQEWFIKRMKSLLVSNGIIVYNAHYQEKNSLEFETLLRVFRKNFSKVDVVFKYPLNRVIILK